jgi:replicative DNA helicase
MKQKHGLSLIVVDYLQLMVGEAKPENRTQEVSQISRALKMVARDLDVPVIALSQLSRNLEFRHDKRPILSDLRESGSIEQDADLVLFVYRDAVYNKDADETEAELILAKHRNGPTGMVNLEWRKARAEFRNAR